MSKPVLQRSSWRKQVTMTAITSDMKSKCNELIPHILAESEKNSKDLEKLLLQRALAIKDERIRNLEERLSSLTTKLQQSEERFSKQEQVNMAKAEITIVNNNIYSNIYCCGCTLLMVLSVFKLLRWKATMPQTINDVILLLVYPNILIAFLNYIHLNE